MTSRMSTQRSHRARFPLAAGVVAGQVLAFALGGFVGLGAASAVFVLYFVVRFILFNRAR